MPTAQASVDRITECLFEAEPALATNSSYEAGILGLSLYYCYYGLYADDDSAFSLAEKYLVKGMDLSYLRSFKRIYKSDSMDGHLSNIGRFLEFSKKNGLLDIDTNTYLKQLDDTLTTLMNSKISVGDFDLNSGAFASAYYFLSRLPSRPELAERFIPLLGGLEEKALKDGDGYSWASPSIFGNVYLGLSHGSAMVISLLVNLWNRDIEKATCERIMRGAVEFLLRYNRDVRFGRFALMTRDVDYVVKPFGQCYGDIGVAYALARANPILQDHRVEAAAMQVINESITRTYERPGSPFPTDAGIFYGASGLGALLEKLGQITGDGRIGDAARYWYRQIPSYAKHENAFAGYQCMFNAESVLYNTSYGWGLIGIGMTLMRYLKPELPPFFDLQMIA